MSDREPEAVACSLSPGQLSSRVRDWRTVVDEGLLDRAAVPGGVRLTFRPAPSIVHDLVELVHAERQCCGWASWTLTSTATGTVVDATADGDGAATLQSLFEV